MLKKYLIIICVVFLCILVSGCKHSNLPQALIEAPPPLTILALNEEGVVLRDGDNALYCYRGSTYLCQILAKSELKAGDTLTDMPIKDILK